MAGEAPEKKEKKRKRDSEKAEKPRKKALINGVEGPLSTKDTIPGSNDNKIAIKHIQNNDAWGPAIVSSAGLTIPGKLSFAPYQSRNQDEILLHSSKHPRLDYLAREKQDGGLEGHLKHYIAIYDPEKKELNMLEARHMSMRSILRTEDKEEEQGEEKEDQGASQAGSNYTHLRNRLGLEFGNKKTKKTIQSITRNAINTMQDPAAAASPEAMKEAIRANPAAAAVLESMTDAAKAAPVREELQAAIDESKPRPKRNPGSTKAKDHYTIDQLIGEDVFKAVKVKPWFDALDEDEEVNTPSRFVAYRLKSIYDTEPDESVMKFKILKWMLILIKFKSACEKARGGKLKLPKKEKLAEKIGEDSFLIDAAKKQFAPSGSEMTKWHVDNLMTHLAAMSLIVDDFITNTNNLMEDLQLDYKQVTLYYREIGAKVVEMTDSQRAQAKLTKVEARAHKIAKLQDELDFPIARPPVSRRR